MQRCGWPVRKEEVIRVGEGRLHIPSCQTLLLCGRTGFRARGRPRVKASQRTLAGVPKRCAIYGGPVDICRTLKLVIYMESLDVFEVVLCAIKCNSMGKVMSSDIT
jgi:hypothetical protein